MKSRTQYSLQNIVFGLGGQAVEVILKFVGRTVFIKCLSVTYLGVNGLFGEILTMLSLAELGIGGAICFALYKPLRNRDEAKIAVLMGLFQKAYIAIGLFIAVAGSLLIPFLRVIIKDAGEVESELTRIYLFYLFNTSITYFFSYKSTLLITDQKNYIVQAVKEVCNILRTAFQCIALLLFRNFYLYLTIESFFIVANNVFVSIYVDRKYPYLKIKRNEGKLKAEEKKDIWKNIRALVLVKVSTLLVNSTDNTLITIYGGIVEVGLYSNYSMFVILFTNIVGQFFANASASVGNLNAEGDVKHSYTVFKGFRLANFWLYSWGAIGFFVMLNPVIEAWLGAEYLLPQYIVAIIAVNFYVKGMMNAVWVFKDSYGLFNYGKYLSFLTALLNLGFSILLGKAYGLAGILAATSLCRLATNVWYDPYALYKHGLKAPVHRYYLEYLFFTCLGIAVCGVTYGIASQIPSSGIPGVCLQLVIVTVIPHAIYYFALKRMDGFAYLKEKSIDVLDMIKTRLGIRKAK